MYPLLALRVYLLAMDFNPLLFFDLDSYVLGSDILLIQGKNSHTNLAWGPCISKGLHVTFKCTFLTTDSEDMYKQGSPFWGGHMNSYYVQ